MEPSALENAVRDHFRHQMEPAIGRSRWLDAVAVARLVESKTAATLPILWETLAEDETPSGDDLFRASMEASHRQIEASIVTMRASTTRDPYRREIIAALADDAEKNLAAFRTLGPDVTQDELSKVTQGVIERMRALTQRMLDDRGKPPAPQ